VQYELSLQEPDVATIVESQRCICSLHVPTAQPPLLQSRGVPLHPPL
jgi:hypothetical protein